MMENNNPKMRCEACDLEGWGETIGRFSLGCKFLCQQCGSELTVIRTSTTNERPAADDITTRQLISMNDLFEIEGLREMIEGFISDASNSQGKKISEKFLKTMGKIALDHPRRTALHDIVLKIGPISIMAISSTFGFLPSECPFNVRGVIVDGVPSCGEADFEHSYDGCIVILHRGIVSFASKALRAIKAGAVALIVIQTLDIWPFMMSDSAGELLASALSSPDGGGLPIPVVMISKTDAELVLKMLSASTKGAQSKSCSQSTSSLSSSLSPSTALLEGCIHYDSVVKDCSICQEVFQEACEILKLPCRHLYHSNCVIEWLQKNNTCPLCRLELPKEENPPPQQNQRPRGSEMSYYN